MCHSEHGCYHSCSFISWATQNGRPYTCNLSPRMSSMDWWFATMTQPRSSAKCSRPRSSHVIPRTLVTCFSKYDVYLKHDTCIASSPECLFLLHTKDVLHTGDSVGGGDRPPGHRRLRETCRRDVRHTLYHHLTQEKHLWKYVKSAE